MKYKYNVFNKNEYESHRLVFDLVKPGSKVLDVGCATGYMANELVQKKHCQVWGVDSDVVALRKAKKYCQTILCNLEEVRSLNLSNKSFETILLLDVLEHLKNPEMILALVRKYLRNNGQLIISVPNVAHLSVRWMLLWGNFDYENRGILDKTHVHFYTQKSLIHLLAKQGFVIEKIIPTNGIGKAPFIYKITDRLPKMWQYQITKMFPTLFAYQFIVVVRLPRGR